MSIERTMLLEKLMDTQHALAGHTLKVKQLTEREKFISQEMSLLGGGKGKPKAEVDEETSDDDGDDLLPAKGSKKAAPAKATGKKAKPADEELDEVTDDEEETDLDDVFGEDEEDAPKAMGEDDVKKLLQSIVKSKGDAGKKKARGVMTKHTKGGSGMVKDLIKGQIIKCYNELKKI